MLKMRGAELDLLDKALRKIIREELNRGPKRAHAESLEPEPKRHKVGNIRVGQTRISDVENPEQEKHGARSSNGYETSNFHVIIVINDPAPPGSEKLKLYSVGLSEAVQEIVDDIYPFIKYYIPGKGHVEDPSQDALVLDGDTEQSVERGPVTNHVHAHMMIILHHKTNLQINKKKIAYFVKQKMDLPKLPFVDAIYVPEPKSFREVMQNYLNKNVI